MINFFVGKTLSMVKENNMKLWMISLYGTNNYPWLRKIE
jgi:hypothetical protein